MMHKRDVDGIAPRASRTQSIGAGAALRSDVHFAMRSDAFETGFLARMVLHPQWFSLFAATTRPLDRCCGASARIPRSDLHLRPAEAWLREALQAEGDQPAGDLLTAEYLAELAAAVRREARDTWRGCHSRAVALALSCALQSYYGPEIFVAVGTPARGAARVGTAKAYLDDIAAWLRHGGSIFNGPEGRLTPDGRISPITSGMYRVLRASPPDTRVVPIALVYDFMTTRRTRLFVDLAPPIEHAPSLSRQDLFATLREAWLRAARFSCTQLASGVSPSMYSR